jgi:thiol-disulfide isomerase/thioredoxin
MKKRVMALSKKVKSDLIFYVGLGLLVVFLFFTPWGLQLRAWMGSWTLSSPNITAEQTDGTIHVSSDWELVNQDGEFLHLFDIEQPIFINIWATWCGPCRSELPSIIDLHADYGKKIKFILVSPSEDIGTLKKFSDDHQLPLEVYAIASSPPNELESSVYPTTYVLSSDKIILLKSSGAHDWNSTSVREFLEGIK